MGYASPDQARLTFAKQRQQAAEKLGQPLTPDRFHVAALYHFAAIICIIYFVTQT
jgi:hypothetical protein